MEGETRGRRATRCRSCLSPELDYLDDNTAVCRSCGGQTPPYGRWTPAPIDAVGSPPPQAPSDGMVPCPSCGFRRPESYRFCPSCGATIAGAAPATPLAPLAASRSDPSFLRSYWGTEIKRTKAGLMFLIVGFLLVWIPECGVYLTGLLGLIGAILAVLGRKPFGDTHSRNVVVSVLLFIFALALAVSMAILFFASITPRMSPLAFLAEFRQFLFGLFIVTFITGFARVLLPYDLASPTGRLLLWAGLVASIALTVVSFVIFDPLFTDAVLRAAAGDLTGLENLERTLLWYQLIDVVPAVLFAAGYFLAWRRVDRGEIPRPIRAPAVWTPPA